MTNAKKIRIWVGIIFALVGVGMVILTNLYAGSDFMMWFIFLAPPYFIFEWTVVDGAIGIQREIWHWLGIIGTVLLNFVIGFLVGMLFTPHQRKRDAHKT